MTDEGIPRGFTKLAGQPTTIYFSDDWIIVEGHPLSEEDDPEGELHNCDDMGCGFAHVLFRERRIRKEPGDE